MVVRNNEERALLTESGRRLALILAALAKEVQAGVSGLRLNEVALSLAKHYEVRPSFLNYQDFPAAVCVSINECVVHGIPNERPFANGELVSLDFGVEYPAKGGLYTDAAVSLIVGELRVPEHEHLIKTTRAALDVGIRMAKVGNRTGDIGAAIEAYVKRQGFYVVRELVGHGVGRAVHEPPQVPNFGPANAGKKLEEGEVIAIEPMVSIGNCTIGLDEGQQGYVTSDGSLSAHFEHTVMVTVEGTRVLTQGDVR